jgi:hypothetical protein
MIYISINDYVKALLTMDSISINPLPSPPPHGSRLEYQEKDDEATLIRRKEAAVTNGRGAMEDTLMV